MLEKKNRIRLDKEFDQIFKTGQSFYDRGLGIKSSNNFIKETRVGFLVGLKVSKKAVIRNKIKRRLRELIRAELPLLKKSKDIVIISLPQLVDMNFNEIKKSLKKILQNLTLYE